MEDEAENNRESSNAQTTLQDVTLHFRNLSNTGRVEASMEEKKARENVRQSCMKFLMYILFGGGNRRDMAWEDNIQDEQSLSSNVTSNNLFIGYSNQYYHSE